MNWNKNERKKNIKNINKVFRSKFIYIVVESYGLQYEPNWPTNYYFHNKKDAEKFHDKLLEKYNKYLNDPMYILTCEIIDKHLNKDEEYELNYEQYSETLELLEEKLRRKYGKSKQKYENDFYKLKIEKTKIN